MVSGCVQTPATTTRLPIGARAQHVVDDARHADGLEYHGGGRGVERRALGGVDGLPGAHCLGQLASLR